MDSAWCPVCHKQIQPKRTTTLVPRTVLPSQPPPAPPSSPRRKHTARRNGLVNGTGRLRHNGTLKPAPQPAPAPVIVMKERVVIDQGPTPLYCSPECEAADLARSSHSVSHLKPAPAPAPPSQSSVVAEPDTEPREPPPAPAPPKRTAPLTSLDKLALLYDFPPMIPMPEPKPEPVQYQPLPYTSGIIMAGRLLNSLRAEPVKPQTTRYAPAPKPRQVIPGWTDGSTTWRSALYSTGAPSFQGETAEKAYGSFSSPARRRCDPPTLPIPPTDAQEASAAQALLASFSAKFDRNVQSRAALSARSRASSPRTAVESPRVDSPRVDSPASDPPTSPSSPSVKSIPSPRSRPLIPDCVKGKILVPDVQVRVPTYSSSTSLRRSPVRSPLSLTGESEEENRLPKLPRDKRPAPETRSWSYDNVRTYDIMPMVPRKVKKIEKRIVDGEEVEVEVTVEEYPEFKRLFLFPPSQRISVP